MMKKLQATVTSHQRTRGFTLVEVLIALVIILSVLVTATTAYSNAQNSSESAGDTVVMLTPLPLILDTVRQQIRTNVAAEVNGNGTIEAVHYNWVAQSKSFQAPPEDYIVENNELLSYEPRFRLYQVELTLSYKNKSRQFTYNEFAWQESLAILK